MAWPCLLPPTIGRRRCALPIWPSPSRASYCATETIGRGADAALSGAVAFGVPRSATTRKAPHGENLTAEIGKSCHRSPQYHLNR